MIQFLRQNADVFAWRPYDMPGLDSKIACHRLHISKAFTPVKQKPRRMSPEKAKAVEEEVQKLLEAGAIREAQFPDWISNPVVVKKQNGKWRVCVDFTDLNKACPKDSFPLPRTDQLVDSVAGHKRLSFLDAYSGYHQIPLYGPDQENTAFVTTMGLYCYKVMPFGLKNAGATFQRAMTGILRPAIGKTVEVYVDDILVKSKEPESHIADLNATFQLLRKFRMKLNAAKCTFGVSSGKFLGYLVNHRGIEANPEKVQALLAIKSPTCVKEVQKLTGMVAALNRFIAKCSDKCHPFFNTIRKSKGFEWTPACEEALARLKDYLATPPLISIPKPHEMLYLYLSASDKAVSAALMRLDDGVQRPIYYVSKTFNSAELNYTPLEKLVLALITASRKLQHYFDAHPITLYTSHPIKAALRRADFSGRMEKWSVELGRYHIEYAPRTAIKGQVMADLIAEFTEPAIHEASPSEPTSSGGQDEVLPTQIHQLSLHEPPPSDEASNHLPTSSGGHAETLLPHQNHLTVPADLILPTETGGQIPPNNLQEVETPDTWVLYIDGSSARTGSGAGIVIKTPDGSLIEQAIRLGFRATNNEAEYEALIIGLKAVLRLGAKKVRVHTDSRLVASQMTGEFAAKNQTMGAYRNLAMSLIKHFAEIKIDQHGRASNSHADALATLASAIPSDQQRTIQVEHQSLPSIVEPLSTVNMADIALGGSWMNPVVEYLQNEQLPKDPDEAHRIKAQATRYWLSPDQILYRRSFSGPYLRCVHPQQVKEILEELHTGSCGAHTGGRSLANRARSQGYWWPYMQKDAIKFTRKCDKCQRYSPVIRQPATELHPLTSPWPFAQWGLDIVGPLPRASGGRRYLLVATDYFTKWVEAEPLNLIGQVQVRNFLWKNIVTRFGIPKALISDNGTQFKNEMIEGFCSQLGITQHFSSVGYPQGNGQAEASNKIILAGLKRRLEAAKGAWVDELHSVLWAYRTTPRRSTGESPFSLTYGTEAVIPVEMNFPTLKTTQVESGGNDKSLEAELDYSQEKREAAMIRLANYQNVLSRQRQNIMKPREFKVGDWVLRKAMGSAINLNDGKLGPNWEGPYKIISASPTGACYLEDKDGMLIPNPWNTHHLRPYYY